MKIRKKFNQLSKKQYFHYIDNYKRYTDFNTLGLYRSIIENEKLSLEDKIEVRDYANGIFQKTFGFYQLKDPYTYFQLTTLGQELTKADEYQIWNNIHQNQQKMLKEKKIKHRNFGNYSKHNCGYDNCPLNGIMIKQGSHIAEMHMNFDTDKNKFAAKEKSKRFKKERKNIAKLLRNELENI